MPDTETSRPSMRDLIHLLNTFEQQGPGGDEEIFRQVEKIGPNCLQELGNRLVRPSIPRSMKRLIFSLPARLPWPAWTPLLQRALMHESDPDLFEEGLRSLALLGGEEQTDALRAIAWQRVEEPFKSAVLRKLEWLEPRQSFEYHLKDLLLGGNNHPLALRAAEHLAVMARAEHLPALIGTTDLEDGHVSRLAYRVIVNLKDPGAAEFLARRFKEMVDSHEEVRMLREALEPLRRLSTKAQAEQLLKRMRASLDGRGTEALDALDSHLAEGGGDPRAGLESLKAVLKDGYEHRLFEAVEIVLSDRPGRLGTLTAQVADSIRRGAPRLHGNLSECALGLVQQTRLGNLAEAQAVELLEWAFSKGLGGESVAWAFATLVEAKDAQLLDRILENPDHRFREAALTVLGEREDPDLLEFLFRATQDSITDLAQKVTLFFGRLPGALPMTLELLHSGHPDKVRQALRIIEANAMRAACEALLALLGESTREDLLCDGAKVLGALRYQPAIPELLRLLHGGQSARAQNALGEALAALALPEAALGLLEKSQPIRNPDLHQHALRGLGTVFQGLEDPIPIEQADRVRHSLQVGLDEGVRFRLAAVESLPALWILSASFYEGFRGILSGYLAEQRKRPSWERSQVDMAGGVLRTLEQRLEVLSGLESRATRLREAANRLLDRPRCEAADIRGLLDIAGPDSPIWQWPGVDAVLDASVTAGFSAVGQELKTLAAYCDLAGRLRSCGFADAAQALRLRSGPGSGLHTALGDLLRRTGSVLPDDALPAHEILLLEPNAFFRRRLVTALQEGPARIREAQDRFEAEALLQEAPADVLVSESADAGGPLYDWLMAQWQSWRVHRVLLSTSVREPKEVREAPWFHGTITKPYRSEVLLERLGL